MVKRKSVSLLFCHTTYILLHQSFYSPTDAQENCLKNNIKIYIKTAYFALPDDGVIAPKHVRAVLM